jgi:hypothetical protein
MQKMPQTRRGGLIVKELDSETLIYDQKRNKAHCLNNTAAKVWKYCDGETTIAEACSSLSRDCGTPIDEKLVWYAVDQFSQDHLLEEETDLSTLVIAGMSRRQMVRTLGLAAVVALPLVTSIVVPAPAQAATCKATGTACASGAECCSGVCSNGPASCSPAQPAGFCC